MLALKSATKVKVIHVTPLAMKVGAKGILPALSFRMEATLSNRELAQLCPGLREFLFTKASTNPEDRKKHQQSIEGVEAVSDFPSLSPAAQRLGTFEWNEEQTGCSLTVDRLNEATSIQLDGCTWKKLQLTSNEGGSIKARFTINTSSTDEIDDETHGKLSKLKKREIHIRLEGPKVDQLPIEGAGSTVTPLSALKNSVEGEASGKGAGNQSEGPWPFPNSGKTEGKKTARAAA